MKVLPISAEFEKLAAGEKFFIEAWYNLTHEKSLDTFRTRCHNARTILNELYAEIRLQLVNREDIQALLAEAKSLVTGDDILRHSMGISAPVLVSLLNNLCEKKAFQGIEGKTEIFDQPDLVRLGYLLTDTLPSVAGIYRRELLDSLGKDIAAGDEKRIQIAAFALAADLVSSGWTLNSLHSWVAGSFLSETYGARPFADRYAFFAEQAKREPQVFEVVLQLIGSSELPKLGEFCGFSFSASVPNSSKMPDVIKFFRTNPQRTFARTRVNAADFYAAAHTAQEKFELCLDRLRFNFSPLPIKLEKRAFVFRGDGKGRLVSIIFAVPNPELLLELDAFLKASRRVDKLLNSDQIDKNSRIRIEATVRHYRLGQDAESYRDKFLNWWMGLETLTRIDERKGIGATVVRNTVDVLLVSYVYRQIRAFTHAVRQGIDKWPESVQKKFSISEKQSVNWRQLLAVMQDNSTASDVEKALGARPWLVAQWRHFCEVLSDPKKLLAMLVKHRERTEWHLMRLWRIRCCLVHGTPIEMRLLLPTANLEYYLREAILCVLIGLDQYQQLASVADVFRRASYNWERRNAELSAVGAGQAAILSCLETDLAFKVAK